MASLGLPKRGGPDRVMKGGRWTDVRLAPPHPGSTIRARGAGSPAPGDDGIRGRNETDG